MNVVKEIQRINERESDRGYSESGSWHAQYKDSSYIFAGGLPYELSEGDVICIFSQYGEILNLDMPRDKQTGKARGFVFLQYEDQRSTVLAVDNLNGAKVLGRVLRVDHAQRPKPKKDEDGNLPDEPSMNAAPPLLDADSSDEESGDDGIDEEDPMAAYLRKKDKKRKRKEEKSKKKSKKRSKDKREHSAHDGTLGNVLVGEEAEKKTVSQREPHQAAVASRYSSPDDDRYRRRRDSPREEDRYGRRRDSPERSERRRDDRSRSRDRYSRPGDDNRSSRRNDDQSSSRDRYRRRRDDGSHSRERYRSRRDSRSRSPRRRYDDDRR
ncbi:RNA-binding protein Cwf29 [Umbelopsis sp. WA50703]